MLLSEVGHCTDLRGNCAAQGFSAWEGEGDAEHDDFDLDSLEGFDEEIGE